jgi:protein TonB
MSPDSHGPTAAIPTTRLLRRQAHHERGWWRIVLLTIGVNAAVVAVLACLSSPPTEPPLPPLATRTIDVIPPAEPPVPPEEMPTPTDIPDVAVPLPALDLPSAAPDAPFTLPSLPPTADTSLPALAITVPLGAVLGTSTVGDAPTESSGPTTPDQPARLPPGIASLLERFYPRAARLRGLTGETEVEVDIAADGTVTNVVVCRATPPGIFDAAVVSALRSVRYQPAITGGVATASRLRQTLQWTLRR